MDHNNDMNGGSEFVIKKDILFTLTIWLVTIGITMPALIFLLGVDSEFHIYKGKSIVAMLFFQIIIIYELFTYKRHFLIINKESIINNIYIHKPKKISFNSIKKVEYSTRTLIVTLENKNTIKFNGLKIDPLIVNKIDRYLFEYKKQKS